MPYQPGPKRAGRVRAVRPFYTGTSVGPGSGIKNAARAESPIHLPACLPMIWCRAFSPFFVGEILPWASPKAGMEPGLRPSTPQRLDRSTKHTNKSEPGLARVALAIHSCVFVSIRGFRECDRCPCNHRLDTPHFARLPPRDETPFPAAPAPRPHHLRRRRPHPRRSPRADDRLL